jgi:hypothetical protein
VQKRKASLPSLPSIQNNRYFKPVEHNNHNNTYKKYLQEVDESSSVFKNRITGYSNINALRHQSQPYHMVNNPEFISKSTLSNLISDTRNKIENQNLSGNRSHVPLSSNTSQAFSKDLVHRSQILEQSYKTMQHSQFREKPRR